MGGRIERRSHSRIKPMFSICYAKCRIFSVRFRWFRNKKSSLVLDGATHTVGAILLCSWITDNIYKHLSHRNMEPTSRLFWRYDPICKFVFWNLPNNVFYSHFLLIVQIFNVCWTSDLYFNLTAHYLWSVCAYVIQRI